MIAAGPCKGSDGPLKVRGEAQVAGSLGVERLARSVGKDPKIVVPVDVQNFRLRVSVCLQYVARCGPDVRAYEIV